MDGGLLDPVGLVRDALARLAGVEDRDPAFAAVFAEEALAVAQPQRGSTANPARSRVSRWLSRTSMTSPVTAPATDRSARRSALPPRMPRAVRRLAAGWRPIILGKATTREYAYGVAAPPTRNPWSLDQDSGWLQRRHGGPRSRQSVATAGLGTDTGGSIRIPAALCGVTGFKPTFGLVSRRGVSALSSTLDHTGPARADCR